MKRIFLLLCLALNLSSLHARAVVPPVCDLEKGKFIGNLLPKGAVGCAIGVDNASFAYHVLLQKEPKKLILIDPWEDNETLYEAAKELFFGYVNVEVKRESAEAILPHFVNSYFDYITLDTPVTNKELIQNLPLYLPKLKPGGFFFGKDFQNLSTTLQGYLKNHDKLYFLLDQKQNQYVVKKYNPVETLQEFLPLGGLFAVVRVPNYLFAHDTFIQKKPKKLFLIESWEGQEGNYKKACDLFAPFSNVEMIKTKSSDAATKFAEQTFDIVYLNELNYNALFRDLTNYLPKIKVGGALIGNAYTEVSASVQKFLSEHSKELQLLELKGNQYLLKKIK